MFFKVKRRKKVHLVLGSGGARGLTQIGIIDVLEEAGYEIISVTGCSMGAVVGGMYAAGFLPAFKGWTLTITKTALFKLVDLTLTKQGFIKGERVFDVLQLLTGKPLIENLSIPFTAVAVDMLHNKEVYYRTGDLYKAIRASIGIPGIFTPVADNGHLLIDGGVLNPLPVNLVQKKWDEIVIAVNLNGPPEIAQSIEAAPKTNVQPDRWSWIRSLLPADSLKAEEHKLPVLSLHELLFSSYQMTQNRLTDMLLQKYPPDILINIPANTCSIYDFYLAKSLIQTGRDKCLEVISRTKKRNRPARPSNE